MSKISVLGICLGLVLCTLALPLWGAMDTKITTATMVKVGLSSNQPGHMDLKTVGFIPLIVSSDGKSYSIEVPVAPAHGTAAYRLASDEDDSLDIASSFPKEYLDKFPDGLYKLFDKSPPPEHMLPPGVRIPLPAEPEFIEVQYVWCAKTLPYDKHRPRQTCELNDSPKSSVTDAYAADFCGNDDKDCQSNLKKMGVYPKDLCPPPVKTSDPNKFIWQPCILDAIYSTKDLHLDGSSGPIGNQAVSLIPAFVLSENQLLIADRLLALISGSETAAPTFTVNSVDLHELTDKYNRSIQSLGSGDQEGIWAASYQVRSGWSSARNYSFDRRPPVQGCRPDSTEKNGASISVTRPNFDSGNLQVDNGIVLDPPKVFDVYTLRQMLNQTALQLSTLSGFNSANIAAALTNLQGVTSGSSFLNAQATASPIPSVQSTPTATPAVPAALTPNGLAAPTNTGESASDLLTDQVQLNAQITSLQLALQGALSDQYLLAGNKSVGTRQQTTIGFDIGIDPPRRYKHALAEVRIWVFPAHREDEINIVNLLPAAKTYNVARVTSSQKQFGASVAVNPISIGVTGGKARNRLYLAKDTDTLAVRFDVDNLRPRVAQWPDRGSHWSGSAWYQNQVTPNTWPKGAKPIGRSPHEAVADVVPAVEAWQIVANTCDQDPGPYLIHDKAEELATPLVFGWQFRPVLGADYVQSGIRSVIAQLALPVGLGAQYAPRVFIQTRWRDYNEKKQVVGGVYPGTCSIQEEPEPIQVVSPLTVRNVDVEDMTGGVLKVVVDGNFLSSSFSVLSGSSTLIPSIFDGKKIQFFGNAESLLASDDLNLAAEDGKLSRVAIKPITPDGHEDACGIVSSYLRATPRPDGNSVVEAVIQFGDRFKLGVDGQPNDGELKPLFLIGTQVYGLHETPFLEPRRGACRPASKDAGFFCTYHFLAPTDSLRAAESYMVRDLAWSGMKKSGKIEFDPSFTALTLLASTPTPTVNPNAPPDNAKPSAASSDSAASDPSPKTATPALPALPPVYTVTGNDLMQRWSIGCGYLAHNCLDIYQGLTPVPLSLENFQVASKTTAVLSVDPPLPAPLVAVEAEACPTPKPAAKPATPGPTGQGPVYRPAPGGAPAPTPTHPASTSTVQGAPTRSAAPPASQPVSRAAPPSPRKPTNPSATANCDKSSDNIAIVDGDKSATILYTTDGHPPDRTLNKTDTHVYDKPFKVESNPKPKPEQIRAIAVSLKQEVSESTFALIEPTSEKSKKPAKGDQNSYKAVPMTTATVGQLSYKSYRFVWYPAYGEPVEWDLPIPQATAPAVTASAVLNESDSTEITFSNIQIQATTPAYPITFLFDGAPVASPVFKYDPVGMTMKVLITGAMTAKPGHKELLLNGYTVAQGSVTPTPVQIELPFDVTKR